MFPSLQVRSPETRPRSTASAGHAKPRRSGLGLAVPVVVRCVLLLSGCPFAAALRARRGVPRPHEYMGPPPLYPDRKHRAFCSSHPAPRPFGPARFNRHRAGPASGVGVPPAGAGPLHVGILPLVCSPRCGPGACSPPEYRRAGHPCPPRGSCPASLPGSYASLSLRRSVAPPAWVPFFGREYPADQCTPHKRLRVRRAASRPCAAGSTRLPGVSTRPFRPSAGLKRRASHGLGPYTGKALQRHP